MEGYSNAYESEAIYRDNLYIAGSGVSGSEAEIGSLEEYLTAWITSPLGSQLTVLGEYGGGKTTLVERVVYHAAKEYLLGGEGARVPLLVRLKDFRKCGSVESVMTDLLVNQFGIDINYKAFGEVNKPGRLLLVLDGFDEVADLDSEDAVLRAFKELDKPVEPRGKLILTRRDHFFRNIEEVHRLHQRSALFDSIDQTFGYELVTILPFSMDQVHQYLHRWMPDEADGYLAS